MSDNNNLIKLWGNDKKRQAFLKAYREWGAWFTTPELGLIWYRYQLPGETTIIAMEYEHEVFAGYPNNYKMEITVRYYVQKKDKLFSPEARSSISVVADLLKGAKLDLMNKAKDTGVSD